WRKLERLPTFGCCQFFFGGPRRRSNFVSARLSNRLNAPEIIATGEDRARWRLRRPVERKHPVLAIWGERDPLSYCSSAGRFPDCVRSRDHFRARLPLHAVATPHHHATPIEGTRWPGLAARKLSAEGNVRRIGERRDAARGESIGKTRACRTDRAKFKPPTSIDSRKQNKQKHHERGRLNKDPACRTYRSPESSRRRSA